MHSDITKMAFEHLPARVQESFQPYLDKILWNAIVPDIFIRDWPNHELNLHGDQTQWQHTIGRIQGLFEKALSQLRMRPNDLDAASVTIGLLSHYIADLNQPLHTDDYLYDNNGIHFDYEKDAYAHLGDYYHPDHGIRLRNTIERDILNTVTQANAYYEQIVYNYATGDGFKDLTNITSINVARAIDDVADIWTTLWFKAMDRRPNVALSSNGAVFTPGDDIELTVTILPGEPPYPNKADLYIVFMDPKGQLWFVNETGWFTQEPTPHIRSLDIESAFESMTCSWTVGDIEEMLDVTAYALLLIPGTDPSDIENWISNLFELHLKLAPAP